MASQRDVKNKISSVKNIQKITRAMEMVAAARLRRAEQRIAALRPYADAIRRMTRQAAQAAGAEAARAAAARASTSPRRTSACCWSPATAASRAASTRRSSAPACALAARAGRGAAADRLVRDRAPRRLLADLPRPRAERQLHGLRRPARLRGRALDRRRPDRRLRRRRARPRRDGLQRLHLAADPARHARDAAAALARDDRTERRATAAARTPASRAGPTRARRLRARPRGDPQAARAGLRRDLDLPRAGGVHAPASSARR